MSYVHKKNLIKGYTAHNTPFNRSSMLTNTGAAATPYV